MRLPSGQRLAGPAGPVPFLPIEGALWRKEDPVITFQVEGEVLGR